MCERFAFSIRKNSHENSSLGEKEVTKVYFTSISRRKFFGERHHRRESVCEKLFQSIFRANRKYFKEAAIVESVTKEEPLSAVQRKNQKESSRRERVFAEYIIGAKKILSSSSAKKEAA